MSDLLYGLRLLRAQPWSTAVTVLGVGAVTTLFSVANGVLLRPLPWATGDDLVRVIESRGGRQGRVPGTMMNGSFLPGQRRRKRLRASVRGPMAP